MKTYIIYKHTCPNGKSYIGLTHLNPIKRWANGKGYDRNKHFYNAILKYGWDNIKHEILFTGLSKEEACQKEIELIAEYKSSSKEFGYNVSLGGDMPSKITRIKMSRAHLGKPTWNKGKRGYSVPNARKVVLQYSLEGTLLNRFNSLREAHLVSGVSEGNISSCCNGARPYAGGYVWKHGASNCNSLE